MGRITSNILTLIFFVNVGAVYGQWWSFSPQEMKEFQTEQALSVCATIRGLSRNQRTLCEVYSSHMQFVGRGAKMGAQECKYQFQGMRWNCSSVGRAESGHIDRAYDKLNTIGSKETAFTYAIASAGIVYSIAKACKNGKLEECGCSSTNRPSGLRKDWTWGGCGDNTEYAYGFSKEFVDAKESEILSPRRKRDRSRLIMNLHNNEVGRLAVVHSARPTCKCHGVSGSCSLKTCWMQLPDFRVIGNKLKQKYEVAKETKVTKRGKLRIRSSTETPTISDLIFVDSSPDYCFKNLKLGVSGTRGRECNADSSGNDGCGFVCCGNGHTTTTIVVESKCNCKFQWCCVVKCQKCKKQIKKHFCN